MGLIRFLLAFAVLFAHSTFHGKLMVPGDIAVQLFFIISGFYMTMILNTKYRSGTLAFFKNRFLRLYPIYIATIVIIIAYGITTKYFSGIAGNNWNLILTYLNAGKISLSTAIFLYFSNISMLFQDVVMFLKINGSHLSFGNFRDSNPRVYSMLLMPQAWSLSLEILFYAIAPFVVKNKKTILIVFLISFAARTVLHLFGYYQDPFSYRFFPSEISVFLLGAASWHLYRDFQFELVKKLLVPIQVGLGIVFVVWPYLFAFDDMARYLFFVPFALFVPYLYNHYSNNSLDYKIGELSYPFYLVHYLALQAAAFFISKLFGKTGLSNVIVVLLAFVITTVISMLLLHFVQGRVEKIRQNIVVKMMAQTQTVAQEPRDQLA